MEREKPYKADSRGYFKVVGSNIVRPIAFMEQQIVRDTPQLEQQRLANQERVKSGKFITKFRPFSGNQAVYDAAARVNRGFGAAGRPRGYSKDYWNTINRANSTKRQGKPSAK